MGPSIGRQTLRPSGLETSHASQPTRPFVQLDRSVRETLIEAYLVPALDWLLPPGRPFGPSAGVSAHAEVALALQSVFALAESDPESAAPYSSSAKNHVDLLVQQAEIHPDGSRCWDHSVWDTAIVLRALLDALECRLSDLLIGPTAQEAIESICHAAMRWIAGKFDESNSLVFQRGLNSAELAQAGLATNRFLEYLRAKSAATGSLGSELSALSLRILNRTLVRRTSDVGRRISEDEAALVPPTWWGDYFGTADVIEYLVSTLRLNNNQLVVLPREQRDLIGTVLVRCMHFLEGSQRDGLWGPYLDTANVLAAYVISGSYGQETEPTNSALAPHPRVVFRSVRWFCDSTQRLADGSILHTAFLTTFFTRAILLCATKWDRRDISLAQLYDEVALVSDGNSTLDKAELVAARQDAEQVRAEIREMRSVMETREKHHRFRVWRMSRLPLSALIILIGCLASLLLPAAFGLVSVNVAKDAVSNLISLWGLIAAIAFALIAIFWSVRSPDDS